MPLSSAARVRRHMRFRSAGRRDVRHGHVAEALHQPAVDRNSKVRLEFEPAKKLRNRSCTARRDRTDSRDWRPENRCARGRSPASAGLPASRRRSARRCGKACAAANRFSCGSMKIAIRIDGQREEELTTQKSCERRCTAQQQRRCATCVQPRAFVHTITSSAPGSTSMRRQSQREHLAIHHDVHRRFECKFDAAHVARRSQRVLHVRAVEKRLEICAAGRGGRWVPSARIRSGRRWCAALGAIIILPPVNLLLLKVRKRQRRRSNLGVARRSRSGKGAASSRARQTSTPRI